MCQMLIDWDSKFSEFYRTLTIDSLEELEQVVALPWVSYQDWVGVSLDFLAQKEMAGGLTITFHSSLDLG